MNKIANQLNLTPELLSLSDVIITDVKESRDGSIHIAVKSTKTEILCHRCKTPMEEIDWKGIKRIGLLGVDEIAQKKGYNDCVTLITSRYQEKRNSAEKNGAVGKESKIEFS